jgi:hypothetical protein
MKRPSTLNEESAPSASKDRALLDSLVETTIAEISALALPRVKREAESDPAREFLARAIAFLTDRPDRDALLKELIAAVSPPQPAGTAPVALTAEARDVRPSL